MISANAQSLLLSSRKTGERVEDNNKEGRGVDAYVLLGSIEHRGEVHQVVVGVSGWYQLHVFFNLVPLSYTMACGGVASS